MQLSTLRPYVTTGVALVGASVIAVTPIAVVQEQAAPPQRSIAVAPAGVAEDFVAAYATLVQAGGASVQALIAGLGSTPDALAKVAAAGVDDPELIPSLLSAIAYGILAQPDQTGNANQSLASSVSAPIAMALALLLPPPVGLDDQTGEPGLLLGAGIQVAQAINDALALLPNPIPGTVAAQGAELPDAVASVTQSIQLLTSGLGESGVRLAKGVALAPLGPLAAAASIADGADANTAVYLMLRNYIDAPLWTADPTIDALKVALPDRAADITNFRDNVLWKATFNVREPIREALGVAPGTGDQAPQTTGLRITQRNTADLQLTGKPDKKDAGSVKVPRSPFKLKLGKDRAAEKPDAGPTSAGSTESNPGPRHRPGPGKVSVRNLFKGARD